MTKEEQFIEALKGNIPISKDFPSVAQAVVLEAGTSSCKVMLTSNDMELEDVLYSATEDNDKGFLLIPKKDTNVLIGLIGDNENSLYLVSIDEVEKIQLTIEATTLDIDKDETVFNGGSNGGLVLSQAVTDEINQIKQDINSLKQVLTTWVPVPQDGGAGLKSAAASWAAQPLVDAIKTDLENDKVSH